MKRILGSVLAPAAFLLAAAAACFASQSNVGGNTAEFLRVGAGARALGMGEAFGPVAEGPEAIYWNPAGLAQARGPEVHYTRSEFLQFFHHDFLAYAQPVAALKGTLAASYTRLSQDSLPVVSNSNVTLGSFSPHSDAIALGYAHAFDTENPEKGARDYFRENWRIPGSYQPLTTRETEPWTGTVMVGGAVKIVSESLYQRSATAVAFDGGAIFRPVQLKELSLSFAFRNAGGKEHFISEGQDLPVELDLGAAYDRRWRQSRLLPAFEFALPYYGTPYAKLGVEYQMPAGDKARVAFRAGYKTMTVSDLSPLTGLTSGIGLQVGKFSVDFGFQPMAELGQVYRFTLGLNW